MDGGAATGAGDLTALRGQTHAYNADHQDAADTYDGAGNPTTYGGRLLTFDTDSRMTAFGSALSASYRSDGLRASKTTSAGTAYFLYDGDDPVCELSGSGAVTAVNTFGAAGLLSRHTAAGSTFYTFDERGDVAQRLDATGAPLSTDLYDAYGARTGTPAAQPDPFGFAGQGGCYTDAETGLVLCGHRYYDPAAGRFINRDPAGYEGGLDLYAYCGGNPTGNVDPSGEAPGPPPAAIVIRVAAGLLSLTNNMVNNVVKPIIDATRPQATVTYQEPTLTDEGMSETANTGELDSNTLAAEENAEQTMEAYNEAMESQQKALSFEDPPEEGVSSTTDPVETEGYDPGPPGVEPPPEPPTLEPPPTPGGGFGLGEVALIIVAGIAGWHIGRKISDTPLITDPSQTYGQAYQNFFKRTFFPDNSQGSSCSNRPGKTG